MRWDPDAVVTGRAAARAWFWPTLACLTVELALRRKARLERVGYRIVERHIPDELIFGWDGVRMTVPALTALDLCSELGGDAIDVALRTRTARLSDLWRALELTPNRRDNALRRQLLEESRDQPWSPPERRFHRLLRAAGITGWSGNITVRGEGWRYNPDVAFEIERLAAEIDGRQYHDTAVAFERDRLRQNRLVCAGWTVLRFTPAMIDTDPEGVIATVQEALANIGRERASVAPARWKSRRK